jgi:hypothetical protein
VQVVAVASLERRLWAASCTQVTLDDYTAWWIE